MINLTLLFNQLELLPSALQMEKEGTDIDVSFQAMLASLPTERVSQHAKDLAILTDQVDRKIATSLPIGGNKLPALTVQNLHMTGADDPLLASRLVVDDEPVSPVEAAITDGGVGLIAAPVQAAPRTAERSSKKVVNTSITLDMPDTKSSMPDTKSSMPGILGSVPVPLSAEWSNEKIADPSIKLDVPDMSGSVLAPQQRPNRETTHLMDSTRLPDAALEFRDLSQLPQSRHDINATKNNSNSILPTRDHVQFGEQLANRLLLLVNEQKYTAQLRLNPPELGLLEVRVDLHNDRANVFFISQHASVRELIEEAFPRLREMLQENGLNLGDTGVSYQLPKRRDPDREYLFFGNNDDQSDNVAHLHITQSDEDQDSRGPLRMLLIDHYV